MLAKAIQMTKIINKIGFMTLISDIVSCYNTLTYRYYRRGNHFELIVYL
jgi:hypothetical protein